MKKKILSLWIAMVLIWVISLAVGSRTVQASNVWWAESAIQSVATETGTNASLISVERRNLVDNIYEYTVILKVGSGEFDKIGIHRVIKEKAPWVPIKAPKAVMMIHGDASSFDGLFLGSTLSNKVPTAQSLGVYLSGKSVDVWGIDLRYTFVPGTTTDFLFMKDWNTALHLGDIRLTVKLARIMRGLTGSGFGKIVMLGISRGAEYTFAYANEETQIPSLQRDLKGIIPMDMVYKFDPTIKEPYDLIQAACVRYGVFKSLYDQGIYYSNEAAVLKYLASLAATDPDGPSPIIPGFTNKQAALFVLSATYTTFDPDPEPPDIEPYVPFYHYLAGTFENEIPTGLRYTNYNFVLDIVLSSAIPSFQSLGEIIEGEALWAGEGTTCKIDNYEITVPDVPYDDHLGEIKIPVFYVGAAGGFGHHGEYTLTLIGSSDKSSLVIELYPLYPPEAVALDYGHADLLWADNAKSLVWQPIYNWINSH